MLRRKGFTLIELLVVMAIIASLLTIALPRYFKSLEHSKEQVLRTNLNTIRESIDKYYADKGRYPEDLEALVDDEYIKTIPLDPITDSNKTWLLLPPKDTQQTGVGDVSSGAEGMGTNDVPYAEW